MPVSQTTTVSLPVVHVRGFRLSIPIVVSVRVEHHYPLFDLRFEVSSNLFILTRLKAEVGA